MQSVLTFETIKIDSIPSLAWCARLDQSTCLITLFHGSGVIVSGRSFVEGCWDGDFEKFDFLNTAVMCGTGGAVSSDEVTFRGSSDRLSPLVSIQKENHIYISNSILFVLSAAEEELDPIYPYYPYDMIKIWRQGDHCLAGRLPLKSEYHLRVHFGAMVKVQAEGGAPCYEIPNPGESPTNYESYKSILGRRMKIVMENASSPERKTKFSPMAALTKGYDSSAACVLAKEAGCKDVFSIADSQNPDPGADTGKENARRLQMSYHEVDRWEFLNLPCQKTAELSLFALASYAPVAAAENLLNNKLFITGHRGDLIWGLDKMSVHHRLEHTWARMISGVNMMEYRLRVGYYILAPATIMERHNHAIQQITRSPEMAPWILGGAYDRPIARRIIEEGGIPRGSFGQKKIGTGHYNFKYQPDSESPIMQNYGEYLKRSHGEIPTLKYATEKVRYQTAQFIWNKLSPNKAKYVRSTPWQRRHPFLLNISPLKLKWESAFTLQWACSILKEQYQFPSDLEDEKHV